MINQKKRCYLFQVLRAIAVAIISFTTASYGQEEPQDDNLAKAIEAGEFVFNGKLRFWYADDEAANASKAYTFGTNFGYLTKSYKGFQIYIEGESVVAITPDLYFDGLNDQTDRTNVTDPETLELNQIHIDYNTTFNNTKIQVKVGRQSAVVEDERFIGNISGRQDDQTYDAIYYKFQNDQMGWLVEHGYM